MSGFGHLQRFVRDAVEEGPCRALELATWAIEHTDGDFDEVARYQGVMRAIRTLERQGFVTTRRARLETTRGPRVHVVVASVGNARKRRWRPPRSGGQT